MEDDDKVMEYYTKSSEINPRYDITWHNMGWIYAKRFEFKKAIQMYLRALYLDDTSHVVWENLRYAYLGAGRFEKAEFCEKKVYQLKPSNQIFETKELREKEARDKASFYT